MATYNNQHWLLSHIRNSFISTDDTGMSEAVMLSDDLPKQFLQRQRPQLRTDVKYNVQDDYNEYLIYPGLDQSDDEDIDSTSQSFDIQMYPEIGVHRYRTNTAQKLEKMDLARKKASRIKSVKFDDGMIHETTDSGIFKRKIIKAGTEVYNRSLLTETLSRCPKQLQNKFIQYAKFDGTSQTGIQTKNFNIFLTMLPEDQRNYPLNICVPASAKIQEVIGFVCYKCSILNPDIPLHSVRSYGLYITEEDGEVDVDFPALDLREPCSKFGFTHLALAERRPSSHITRIDYRSLSMTSETETLVDSVGVDLYGISSSQSDGDMARMLGHNSMIEAPIYRTYRVYIMGKPFFRNEVQLGISGERIEIDPVQQKNSMVWSRQKAISYNIECIAYCEITEQKSSKAIIRIWYLTVPPQSSSVHFNSDSFHAQTTSAVHANIQGMNLSNSPLHYNANISANNYKYFDFETDINTAHQIYDKINFILEVRSSVSRREFLIAKKKKSGYNVKKTFSPFGKL